MQHSSPVSQSIVTSRLFWENTAACLSLSSEEKREGTVEGGRLDDFSKPRNLNRLVEFRHELMLRPCGRCARYNFLTIRSFKPPRLASFPGAVGGQVRSPASSGYVKLL